jgi:hypothetical protein
MRKEGREEERKEGREEGRKKGFDKPTPKHWRGILRKGLVERRMCKLRSGSFIKRDRIRASSD